MSATEDELSSSPNNQLQKAILDVTLGHELPADRKLRRRRTWVPSEQRRTSILGLPTWRPPQTPQSSIAVDKLNSDASAPITPMLQRVASSNWRSTPLTRQEEIDPAGDESLTYEERIAGSRGPRPMSEREMLDERPVAPDWSLVPGSLVWIPESTNEVLPCIREGHCDGELLREAGLDHPAIILGNHSDLLMGQDVKYCSVAQVRTFRGTSPDEYLRMRSEAQQFFESLPIRFTGTNSTLDELNPLELCRGWTFKQSYVQLQHIFRIPVELIQVFHHGSKLASDVCLKEESYIRLMGKFGLVPQPWAVPTYPRKGPEQVKGSPVMQGMFEGSWTRAARGGRGGRRHSGMW